MINYDLLSSEYQDGFLDADGLRPYIGLGLLTQDQFNQITNQSQSNQTSNASNASSSANSTSINSSASSSSFNPVE